MFAKIDIKTDHNQYSLAGMSMVSHYTANFKYLVHNTAIIVFFVPWYYHGNHYGRQHILHKMAANINHPHRKIHCYIGNRTKVTQNDRSG